MSRLRLMHPFLFALYPALFLYTQNINHFQENVLITPLLVSLAFALLVLLMCVLITRRLEVSMVLSSAIILIIFSYSRIKEPLKNIQLNLGNVYVSPDMILFAVILFVVVILIFLTAKNKFHLKKINKALGTLSLILISITFFNLISLEIKLGRNFLSSSADNFNQLQSSDDIKIKPDIYYFILDRYGGNKTLEGYGFDNRGFIKSLQDKGFYIAFDSTSNYSKTFLSLGSTLNMEYLDFLTQKTNGGATSDESIVTPLVQNNKIIQFLKNKGYLYVHVGSGWDPTRSNPYADYNLVMNGGRYPFTDEFTSGLLQTTIVSPILKRLYPDTAAVSRDPKNNDARSRVLYAFDAFDQIPQIDGPKFVFAHILIPHEPYVLDKDCEPLAERTVISRTGIENYLNQLQCANRKMEIVVNQILAKSKTKPIIIIQADEGPLPIKNPISNNLNWKNASDASLWEKFPILNAYLLPGLEKNPLYPSITPVNSFRVIFNSYFNTDLPLLPDRNIVFEDDQSYYKFIDVTERLKD